MESNLSDESTDAQSRGGIDTLRRVGVDRLEDVFVMENHDEALSHWRRSGLKGMKLVHLDAHHDLYGKWTVGDDDNRINIGNFIFPAIEAGIVSEILWVVPDPAWSTRKRRRLVRKCVQRISKLQKTNEKVKTEASGLTTRVLGVPLTVVPVSQLALSGERVLLDIDVDFLTISEVGGDDATDHGEAPWLWPEDLVSSLRRSGLQSPLVTIAYSVEGGYTTLPWKYLGDELALRLRRPDLDGSVSPELACFELLRGASEAVSHDDLTGALDLGQKAHAAVPSLAAPCLHLAHLSVAMGRAVEGRAHYRRALSLDPAYRTAYSGPGIWHLNFERYELAGRAFERILALDEDDPWASLGTGFIASHRRAWPEAERWLQAAVGLAPESIDAWRSLGHVLMKRCRYAEAVQAYERSVRLVLRGHRALDEGPIGFFKRSPIGDAGHGVVHARLARLAEKLGSSEQAVQGYRMSLAMGADRFVPRMRLSVLLLKLRQWRPGLIELGIGVGRSPLYLGRALRRGWYRARYKLRLAFQRASRRGVGSSVWL